MHSKENTPKKNGFPVALRCMEVGFVKFPRVDIVLLREITFLCSAAFLGN